ncbi:hypothetical protein Y032_0077g1128 [Ancylostoma ceylanicum]|uniref:Uncharacterized protein n=1 Tax=Ancylostoma ceylanicum TaxID=53326 RepID=A0A016TUH7_9BILA|nr:hypothetical protein Y032_0077g1128 [Ancylostoma ceylanicum]
MVNVLAPSKPCSNSEPREDENPGGDRDDYPTATTPTPCSPTHLHPQLSFSSVVNATMKNACGQGPARLP